MRDTRQSHLSHSDSERQHERKTRLFSQSGDFRNSLLSIIWQACSRRHGRSLSEIPNLFFIPNFTYITFLILLYAMWLLLLMINTVYKGLIVLWTINKMSYKRITKTKIDKLKGQAHIFIIIDNIYLSTYLKIKYKVVFNASLIDSAIWTHVQHLIWTF